MLEDDFPQPAIQMLSLLIYKASVNISLITACKRFRTAEETGTRLKSKFAWSNFLYT